MKQAGHEWYKMLRELLQRFGLSQTVGDKGIYFGPNIIVGTHVNNLLVIGEEPKLRKL